jgi:hypothetical protein
VRKQQPNFVVIFARCFVAVMVECEQFTPQTFAIKRMISIHGLTAATAVWHVAKDQTSRKPE